MGNPTAVAGFGRTPQGRCHDPGVGAPGESADGHSGGARNASDQAEAICWFLQKENGLTASARDRREPVTARDGREQPTARDGREQRQRGSESKNFLRKGRQNTGLIILPLVGSGTPTGSNSSQIQQK